MSDRSLGFAPEAIHIVAPAGGRLDSVFDQPPLAVFSTEALAFLDDLASAILRSPATRQFPELMALGFWMRPASIRRLVARYQTGEGDVSVLLSARGTIFHLAPSNVDTIFVYSWLVSLLAGNTNVVRLSRKNTPQVEALLQVLTAVLDQAAHAAVRARTLLVRFDPDPAITAYFSNHCDVRVIWGGDATVQEIRNVPLPPLSTEVVFGDRFSIGVLRASAWSSADQQARSRLIHQFVNDAYWFMQMACSSPRMVVWVGADDEIASARESFWTAVREEVVVRSFDFSPREYIAKRAATAGLAIERPIHIEAEPTGDVTRVWADSPTIEHRDRHCGAGLFWEAGRESLDAIAPFLDRRIQTVAHFGFSAAEIADVVRRTRPRGGDRWVPVGHALDFDHIWDGFDLVRTFSRHVTIAE